MKPLELNDLILAEHKNVIKICSLTYRQWLIPLSSDDNRTIAKSATSGLEQLNKFCSGFEKAQIWSDISYSDIVQCKNLVQYGCDAHDLISNHGLGMNGFYAGTEDIKDQLLPLYVLLSDLKARIE